MTNQLRSLDSRLLLQELLARELTTAEAVEQAIDSPGHLGEALE